MRAFSYFRWFLRRPRVFTVALGASVLTACAITANSASPPCRAIVLNGLRDEINTNYGDKTGTPRINCGPCARFAIAFRERWNARFDDKINLACVLTHDRKNCGHVVVKFADGTYFDGGNGVMSDQRLRLLFPDHPIEEMVEFDRNRLDRLVGGLDHERYPECPNYSEDLTVRLIDKHLAQLMNN